MQCALAKLVQVSMTHIYVDVTEYYNIRHKPADMCLCKICYCRSAALSLKIIKLSRSTQEKTFRQIPLSQGR